MPVRIETNEQYFEDFKIGTKLKSNIGRTITENDNIWFTLLTNNSNQIHFNKDYAAKIFPGEPFGGRMVVNGLLSLAIVVGLLVNNTSANGFMLGLDKVKFVHPVFPGDTIYAECEVTEVKESNSRKDNGIVKLKTAGYNQKGEKIVEFDRIFMIRKRGSTWVGRRSDVV